MTSHAVAMAGFAKGVSAEGALWRSHSGLTGVRNRVPYRFP